MNKTRITEEIVIEIFRLKYVEKCCQQRIAEKVGIGIQTVGRVLRREHYKDITVPNGYQKKINHSDQKENMNKNLSVRKVVTEIAGMPIKCSLEEVLNCTLSLKQKMYKYFLQASNNEIFNIRTIAYIDNYLLFKKYFDDEEELRDQAWATSEGISDFHCDQRPDIAWKCFKYEKLKPNVNKTVKFFRQKSVEGWVNLRHIVHSERHELISLNDYLQNIIVKNGIEHQRLRVTKGATGAMILLEDYLEKYFNKKYDI